MAITLRVWKTQPPSDGLADALDKSWPPSRVLPKDRLRATIAFLVLVAVFSGLSIWNLVTAFRDRYDPPVSLSRDTSDTRFRMPVWTVCRPYGPELGWWDESMAFEWVVDCGIVGIQDSTACPDLETTRIRTALKDDCIVVVPNSGKLTERALTHGTASARQRLNKKQPRILDHLHPTLLVSADCSQADCTR